MMIKSHYLLISINHHELRMNHSQLIKIYIPISLEKTWPREGLRRVRSAASPPGPGSAAGTAAAGADSQPLARRRIIRL